VSLHAPVKINAQYMYENNPKSDKKLMEKDFIHAVEFNEGELPEDLDKTIYKLVSVNRWEMNQT
jgi:hypothetical protein